VLELIDTMTIERSLNANSEIVCIMFDTLVMVFVTCETRMVLPFNGCIVC